MKRPYIAVVSKWWELHWSNAHTLIINRSNISLCQCQLILYTRDLWHQWFYSEWETWIGLTEMRMNDMHSFYLRPFNNRQAFLKAPLYNVWLSIWAIEGEVIFVVANFEEEGLVTPKGWEEEKETMKICCSILGIEPVSPGWNARALSRTWCWKKEILTKFLV